MTVIKKVPFTAVELTGGLWHELMETNRIHSLPIQHQRCLETGRLEALKLKEKKGCDKPHIFWDSDVAKWIEAAAYSLAAHPDAVLERKVDKAIADIKSSQCDDGYFNSHFQIIRFEERWTNLRDRHELYCAGHLMEAAVAYHEATGKRVLLEVMIRYADHIDTVFGPKRGQLKGYSGHQEIELGLVKLYEATEDKRYLTLAAFFIHERGQQRRGKPHYFDAEAKRRGEASSTTSWMHGTYEYNQSHLPVLEQTEVVGHAVRALYLYCGMADVAAHTGDKALLKASKVLWQNLVTRRMAITGGVGPRSQNEGMTTDFDLPAEGAYLETCAAIALVFWAHRLFIATGDGQYLDVMERCIYNSTISGIDRTGTRFFYGNPLAVAPGFDGNGGFVHPGYHYRRVPWFDCSCCPTNLGRFIAQFPGTLYAVKGKTLLVSLYADSRSTIDMGRSQVTVIQKTDYPWDGKVTLTVHPEEAFTWTLALRIPAWCRKAEVKVNGRSVKSTLNKGFMEIQRQWIDGDRVCLILPMPVEQIAVNPKARQVSGQVAIQRGPVVYCLEETDNGPDLANLYLAANANLRLTPGPDSLGGVPCITGMAKAEDLSPWKDTLYAPAKRKLVNRPIQAIPYFLWANRDPGEMTVFIKRG